MTTRTATCACGQLRIVCDGEPAFVAVCHCTACQKRTGTAYSVSAYYPVKQVLNIEGASKVFTRRSDAERDLHMHFCPECGSTVYWEPEWRPGHLAVAVGSFADPSFPKPTRAVWTEHRWQWLPALEGVPSFNKGSV
jgi:hypothetical protein